MEVFISADMEGVSGVAAAEDVVRGTDAYERGQTLLHEDVNAAIDGAFDGGATSVVANDSHSSMRNLEAERLDERASLIRGSTKPRSMMQGLTRDHDVAFFVGYHAMAGTAAAVLNHTFYGHELVELSVDGVAVGELGWNARLAGALGVPVGLVTGDDATAAETSRELGADGRSVIVKNGIDRFSAHCRPVTETTGEIRTSAATALRAVDDLEPVEVGDAPHRIEAQWITTNLAVAAAGVPGVERVGGRRTAVVADTYPEAFDASVGMLRAASAGRDEYYG